MDVFSKLLLQTQEMGGEMVFFLSFSAQPNGRFNNGIYQKKNKRQFLDPLSPVFWCDMLSD